MLLKNAIIILDNDDGVITLEENDSVDNVLVYERNDLPDYVSDMLAVIAGPDAFADNDDPFDLSDYSDDEDAYLDDDYDLDDSYLDEDDDREPVDVKFYKDSGRISREIYEDHEVKYHYLKDGTLSRAVITSY
jgi:hypothetical protein